MYKLKAEIETEKEAKKEEWLEEKRREREQRDRERSEQLKQQLSVEDRDQAIRKVLAQLTLDTKDREKLRGRGLTDDQINEAQYRSVKKWQELDGVTAALAGINRRGNLNNPWDGILIPIPNEDGLWVGMRLHDPDNKETGNTKYIWLSSPKSGKTPHYRNGENPIAVYYPSEYRHYDRIGLCEGLEWKPKIAAERLGYPVIGFSGSHFDTSPLTLKIVLQKIQEKLWIIQQGSKSNRKLENKSSVSNGLVKETEISISKELPPKTSTLVGELAGTNIQNGEQTLTVASTNDSGLKSGTSLFLIPDGGMSANPNVFKGFQKTAKLLNGWGYTNTSILDWGQLNEKGDNDIDEISSEVLESAIAIPASEFFKSDEQKALEAEHGKEIDPFVGKRDRAINAIEEAFNGIQQTAIDFIARAKVKEENEEPPILYAPDPKSQPSIYYKANRLEEIEGEIIYGEGQRQQVWSEAVAKGVNIILDRSATGQGKSYTASQLKNTNFDFGGGEEKTGQLIYFLGEPDNPSVPLEGWERIPTLKESNCHKWEERRALAAKGVGRSSGKGKHDANPICNSCPFLSKCREGVGEGYGHKYQMKETLSTAHAYGHPLGFPREKNSDAIAFYDEFQALVPPTVTRSVGLKLLSRTFLRLEQRDYVVAAEGEPDNLYDDLIFLKEYLEPFLSGAEQTPTYGIDFATIKKIKPDWDEEKISQILTQVEELEERFSKDDLNSLDGNSTPEDVDRIVDVPWLAQVLSILLGDNSGALRVWGDKLLITKPNEDAIAQVKSFKTSILLDATLTKEDLIWEYGFKSEEILECRQAPTPTPNFKIKQLTRAGLNTSQRSDAGQERKEKIITEIKRLHDDEVGVIDYKSHSSSDDELHHFRSGEEGARGSNRFSDRSAIVSIGTPFIALNAAIDNYQAITGEIVDSDRARENQDFSRYYDRLTQKEIVQGLVGRMRANLRPDKTLTGYLVNDFDPSFLSSLGIEVTRQPVWDVVRDLRPRFLEKLEGLGEFFAGLVSRGHDLSRAKLKDAAQSVGSTSADLSRLLKQVGGWFSLREKINKLFKVSKEAVNFSDWESIFKTKLGDLYGATLLDSPETLVSAIEEHGWQAFYEFFKAAQISIQGELLAMLLQIILRDRANWVEQVFQFCTDQLELTEQDIGINSPPDVV
jgi:hypothetical protein